MLATTRLFSRRVLASGCAPSPALASLPALSIPCGARALCPTASPRWMSTDSAPAPIVGHAVKTLPAQKIDWETMLLLTSTPEPSRYIAPDQDPLIGTRLLERAPLLCWRASPLVAIYRSCPRGRLCRAGGRVALTPLLWHAMLQPVNKQFDLDAVEFKSFQTFQEKPFDTPLDRKVVLRIHARSLHVTKPELKVLKAIAGTRFNNATQMLKLVTMRHQTVAENKRELLELLYNLVSESKAIAKDVAAADNAAK
jgi:hypothetical protein